MFYNRRMLRDVLGKSRGIYLDSNIILGRTLGLVIIKWFFRFAGESTGG
jgi:hypothetical protein